MLGKAILTQWKPLLINRLISKICVAALFVTPEKLHIEVQPNLLGVSIESVQISGHD